MTKLLYRMVPHNGGAVFSEEGRAMHIVQINRALESSKTWGEFKRSIPPDEYQRIVDLVELEEEDQTEPDTRITDVHTDPPKTQENRTFPESVFQDIVLGTRGQGSCARYLMSKGVPKNGRAS